MRLLFLGDIMGRAGRDALMEALPDLRAELSLDFVVVNGENAAGGVGITPQICEGLYQTGVDAITTGNHVWDAKEIIGYIGGDARLLRPVNYPKDTPGRGAATYSLADGRRVLVVNVMTRLFMDPLDDPFPALDTVLQTARLGRAVDAVIVDVHGEATSEKMAIGHYLDGRASLVVGTHSHIPTADAHVLPGGTAYQSDAGMCGDYDSVIGMEKEPAMRRFIRKMPTGRVPPATGPATLCGVFVETDDATGLARTVAPLRRGGILAPAGPA